MISTLTGGGAGPVAGFIFGNVYETSTLPYNAFALWIYRKNALAPERISFPSNGLVDVFDASFSNNANYLSVVTAPLDSKGARFYSRSGTTFSEIAIPSGSLNATYLSTDISSDGSYFLIAGNGFVRVYHNNAGSLTFLWNGTQGIRSSMSPNGVFVAGGYGDLLIYKRSGSGNSATFALHQTIANISNNQILAVRFSKDGTYIAVTYSYSPFVRIYKYNSSTDQFAIVSNQPPSGGVLPTSGTNLNFITWSFDSSMLAVGDTNSALLYERSGDTFTHRFSTTSGGGYQGSFHPSGNYFILGQGGKVYRKITASNWQDTNVQLSGGFQGCRIFSPYI